MEKKWKDVGGRNLNRSFKAYISSSHDKMFDLPLNYFINSVSVLMQ
jgi:hypothetical protein